MDSTQLEENLTDFSDINENNSFQSELKDKKLSVLSHCISIIDLASDGLISEDYWQLNIYPRLIAIQERLNQINIDNTEIQKQDLEENKENTIEQCEILVLQLRTEVLAQKKAVQEQHKELQRQEDQNYFAHATHQREALPFENDILEETPKKKDNSLKQFS